MFGRTRAARVERVSAHLLDPDSWFLLANEGPVLVGMASAEPLRGNDGMGPAVPGGCFLNYLFVVPERWGEGIGGVILDAVLAQAKRRNYSRIHLWTERRQRAFAPSIPEPQLLANGPNQGCCERVGARLDGVSN
jgi:GNAT superfamily N-acetyltransferase